MHLSLYYFVVSRALKYTTTTTTTNTHSRGRASKKSWKRVQTYLLICLFPSCRYIDSIFHCINVKLSYLVLDCIFYQYAAIFLVYFLYCFCIYSSNAIDANLDNS